MIVLTQMKTGGKIALAPTHWILHEPRKLQLAHGKQAFKHTTLMSIMNPAFCESVQESYSDIKDSLLPIFSELTHGETGTKFLFWPDYFSLVSPGCIEPFGELVTGTCLISIWEPSLWVPIKESFEEALNIFQGNRKDG